MRYLPSREYVAKIVREMKTLYSSFYIQDRVICNQLQWTEKIELGMDLGEREFELFFMINCWHLYYKIDSLNFEYIVENSIEFFDGNFCEK